jgi:hypothetical protein
MEQNTPDGVAAATRRLFANLPERSLTRAYAERFSWDDTTAGQVAVFSKVCGLAVTSEALEAAL